MAINYRDPRYQRAMLKAGANPLANIPAAASSITGQFAAQQQGIQNKLSQLFTAKRGFESSMKLARGRQEIAEDKMDWQKKQFAQGLKDARQEMNRGIMLGLGTAGLSVLEGRRRAKLIEQDTALKRKLYEKLLKEYGRK